MSFEKLSFMISPDIFREACSCCVKTFRRNSFVEHCGDYRFVQYNHNESGKGVPWGLHYHLKQPQGKLVRGGQGEVFDVEVYMRRSSPTFGHRVGVWLSDEKKLMLWGPPGFAHCSYVTSKDAEFQCKRTDYYVPDDEASVLWNNPDSAIDWPLAADASKCRPRTVRGKGSGMHRPSASSS